MDELRDKKLGGYSRVVSLLLLALTPLFLHAQESDPSSLSVSYHLLSAAQQPGSDEHTLLSANSHMLDIDRGNEAIHLHHLSSDNALSSLLYKSPLEEAASISAWTYQYPWHENGLHWGNSVYLYPSMGMTLSLPGQRLLRSEEQTWQDMRLSALRYQFNTSISLGGDLSRLWDYRFDIDYHYLPGLDDEANWAHRASLEYRPFPRAKLHFGYRLFADGESLRGWQRLSPMMGLEWQLD